MISRNWVIVLQGLPEWLSDKNPPAHAGDMGSAPGSGRSPGEGNSNPLQYSCLEDLMDGGAWRATGCKELDTTESLVSGVSRVLSQAVPRVTQLCFVLFCFAHSENIRRCCQLRKC